jgi:hypothetical protein
MRKEKSKKVKSKDALRGIRIKALQSELGWTMDGGKQKSKKVESKDALKCIRVKALKSELGRTMDGETKEQQHIGCQSKGTKVK